MERFALEQQCRDRGVEPIVLGPGSDLLAIAEDAVQRGADVIGMAGGDGSQALVASVASRHGVPFVVVLRARATTSRSTSASTGPTSSAPWTPSTTGSTGASTSPSSTGASS